MENNLYKAKLWKRILSVILAVIIGFGTFVTMTFSNVLLSDYVDLKSMFTANAATLNLVPLYYRHGELIGLYKVDYSDKRKLQYKIGENGKWTNYSVPFAIPAHKTTKVYTRIGETGKIAYYNLSNTNKALGVYTESNTDFSFSYNGIEQEYITVPIKIGLNQSTVKFLLPTADLRLLSLTAQNILWLERIQQLMLTSLTDIP